MNLDFRIEIMNKILALAPDTVVFATGLGWRFSCWYCTTYHEDFAVAANSFLDKLKMKNEEIEK